MPSPPTITAHLRNWSLDDERCTISGWVYDVTDFTFFTEGAFVLIKYRYMIHYKNVGASPENWLIRSLSGDYFRVYEFEQFDLNANGKK